MNTIKLYLTNSSNSSATICADVGITCMPVTTCNNPIMLSSNETTVMSFSGRIGQNICVTVSGNGNFSNISIPFTSNVFESNLTWNGSDLIYDPFCIFSTQNIPNNSGQYSYFLSNGNSEEISVCSGLVSDGTTNLPDCTEWTLNNNPCGNNIQTVDGNTILPFIQMAQPGDIICTAVWDSSTSGGSTATSFVKNNIMSSTSGVDLSWNGSSLINNNVLYTCPIIIPTGITGTTGSTGFQPLQPTQTTSNGLSIGYIILIIFVILVVIILIVLGVYAINKK
jgi:hypothetical protein